MLHVQDSFLELTGPTRAVMWPDTVTIEAVLKVKGTVFFFCETEDILSNSTVHPPFYKQDPEEKENYKRAPMATVHLPLHLRHPVRHLHRLEPPNLPPITPRDPKPW